MAVSSSVVVARNLARPGRTAIAYGAALAIGLALLAALMPLAAITGGGGLWRAPAGDMAQTLTGHLAFQQDAWRVPPLFTENLFWPRGISLALTDSNPLFSLAAKLAGGSINLLGVWLALCWLLQPVAAVFALRALTPSISGAITAAVLAGLFPALLFRVGHVNLCGHFIILAALGLTLRLIRAESARRWVWAGALLMLAILSHPYLFMIAAAVLAAAPLDATIRRRAARRSWAGWLLACLAAALVFAALAGVLSGSDKGFVYYSMNLISPFWPQRSGLFGASLPIIDATGGQYEGFCYLGAGTLLLLFAALPRASALRRWPGLVVLLALLTLTALSSRVYVGHWRLLDLGAKPWEDIFGLFRASGRSFWPVGYALVLGAIAAVARLPARARLPLFAAAMLLQLIDTAPLRREAARVLAGDAGAAEAVPPLPSGVSLLTVLPTPGCTADPAARAVTNPLLLAGVRAGAKLGDIGIGRTPVWFNCEAILSDGVELPLRDREVRVYADLEARAALRPALLGADAGCAENQGVTICARGLTPAGAAIGMAAGAAAQLDPGERLADAALAAGLGLGWRADPDGRSFWSEGPRASLVLAVGAARDLTLTLRIAGIAQDAGAVLQVQVIAGREALGSLALRDGAARDVTLHVSESGVTDGVLRLAFDIFRPVDPAKRGLAIPAHRAGLHLFAIERTR